MTRRRPSPYVAAARREPPACRSCGASLLFVPHAQTRRAMPLTPATDETGPGDWRIERDLDGVAVAMHVTPGQGTHRSHFADCPNADHHRQARP